MVAVGIGHSRDLAAVRVIRPLYELGRALRPSSAEIQRQYMRGLAFRTASAAWSEDQKRAWVVARLRRVVRYAADTTPFYAERWRAIGFDPRAPFSLAEFRQLPLLTRTDLQDHGERLVSAAVDTARCTHMSTGGSTGSPVTVVLGPRERAWRESGAVAFMRGIGVPPGARRGLLWAHHLDPVARETLMDRLKDLATNRRWYECLRLSPDVLRRHHDDLEQYKPTAIIAYASALTALAEFLLEEGITPSYPTNCCVTGAEKLHAFQRELIEEAFGKSVFERYGGRDVGDMGFQTSAVQPGEFEVDWPLVMLEPLTAMSPAPIVVTKLQADAMPMIRYEVGDVADFGPTASPGEPALWLKEVLGRRVDRVMLPSGAWLHGCHFPHLFKDFALRDFQVHQKSDYSLSVSLVPLPGLSDDGVDRIRANIVANLPGLPVNVSVVPEIPRGAASKWRPVVSDVTAARAGPAGHGT